MAIFDAKCRVCSAGLKRKGPFAGAGLAHGLFYVSVAVALITRSLWPFLGWALVLVALDMYGRYVPDPRDPITKMQLDRIERGKDTIRSNSDD